MRVSRLRHIIVLCAVIAAAAIAAVPSASGGSFPSATNGWIGYLKTTMSGGGMGGPPVITLAIKGVKADGTTAAFASSITGVPSWSADGSKIAWLANDCVGFVCEHAIKVADPDGTDAITVLDDADIGDLNVQSITLNANGTKIAFAGQDGPEAVIWMVDAVAGQSVGDDDRVVVGAGAGDNPTSPEFSNDGKLAYLNGLNCTLYSHIWVLANPVPGTPDDGTELTRTCDSGGNRELVTGLSWSPDGTQIAYGVDKTTAAGRLYKIAADNSTDKVELYATTDTSGNVKVKSAAWSPDGLKIAFTEGDMGSDPTLKMVNASDGSGVATVSTDLTDEAIAWGPNVSITAGSGGVTPTPTPTPKAWTLKKGKSASFAKVASKTKFTYPRGAKLSATSQTPTICKIKGGKVKALKVGTCTVTLKAKPKKSAATMKQVSFSVVA